MSASAAPEPRAPGRAGRSRPSAARTAAWLAATAFLIYAATGGGRVVGSDEVTMFELGRAMLAGRIDVPPGATLEGRGGRSYTKNSAAQAIAALPLVAVGEGLSRASGLAGPRRSLASRFVVSFFNALATAALLGVFYAGVRSLGCEPGATLAAAVLLGFTTPLWVYAKSFMAEPLQGLGLLLAGLGASRAGGVPGAAGGPRSGRLTPERLAGLGAFIAVSVKLSMLPLALGVLAPLVAAPWASWRAPAAGLGLALAGHALYNAARFGTPFETGYGAQATPAAYTTPLLVGLYGLLISSGKGALWFAPALWLAPSGWRAMLRAARFELGNLAARLGLARPAGRAAWSVLLGWLAALLLYARFQHWAGDGSYGPRYLVPLLPLAFVAVAFALRSRAARAAALALGVLGLGVQIGGVAIYFGAQMREAGDYPYRLPLEDPRFMSESHFHPAFSPIAGHWRMLVRNAGEHLRGHAPRLAAEGGADPRLGIDPGDQQALLHGLDFWWLYLGYAGLPRAPVGAALLALLGLAAAAGWRARRALAAERSAP
jgi:hypothetical protein